MVAKKAHIHRRMRHYPDLRQAGPDSAEERTAAAEHACNRDGFHQQHALSSGTATETWTAILS